MPQIPIIMPQLGESIAEATIVNIAVQVGDQVEADQDVIEVETNKAVMSVTTPCPGRVGCILVEAGQSYSVGAILGYMEATEEDAVRLGLDTAPAPAAAQAAAASGSAPSETPAEPAPARASTQPAAVQPTVRGLPVPAHAAGASYMSPRLKARMAELGLQSADLAGIAGSGAGGRVTIQDFEKYLAQLEHLTLTPASPMRVAVADAMRRSATRPIASVGRPLILDPMLAHRKQSKPKAGPALYLIRALAIALSENSAPAGRLIGDRIVHPASIDIGFAVEADDGVLVPVIQNVDAHRLADLVVQYDDLVEQARQRHLPPSANGPSVATVTNFGGFGLTFATPIPLPEQTLVLGLGTGNIAPHWNPETRAFEPVTEAIMTLSFDHRVLDGGAAGRLLRRVAELLADPVQL
ncbi:MAG: 2-oxo acid dehydrogenase subunit E2 [Chthoniobacteraceae bacterium]|nr:2-oxo acid dehydrogenase subunit E2 [Chthoniobacteraceae bacterium]